MGGKTPPYPILVSNLDNSPHDGVTNFYLNWPVTKHSFTSLDQLKWKPVLSQSFLNFIESDVVDKCR